MVRFYAIVVQVIFNAVVVIGQGLRGCGSELFGVTNFLDSNIQPRARVYTNESTVTICLNISQYNRQCRAAR